jgi:hypothetical protein
VPDRPPEGSRVSIYGETLLFHVWGGGVVRRCRMGWDGVPTLSAGVLDFLGWMNSAWGIAISDRGCIVMGSG